MRMYKLHARRLQKIIDGKTPMTEITMLDLQRVIISVPPLSAHRVFRYIKRLFSYLEFNEVITKNVARKLETPKKSKRIIRPLNMEDIAKIMEAAKTSKGKGSYLALRDQAILALFVGTGIRRAELCLLQDRDVDFEHETLFIKGKGDKERLIPIASKLKLLLWRYKAARNKTKANAKSHFFFKTNQGNGFHPDNVYKVIKRISKLCGVKFYPHKLRHTFCTEFMSQDGADLLHLKAIAGWESFEMAKRYAEPSMAKLRRNMGKFSPIERIS
jgi:site-specific recombinase XerD